MKKYLTLVGTAILILTMSLGFSSTAVADNLYSEKTEEIVTKGVTYSYEHRLATAGWQNIRALEIDLTSDNVKIAPVESKTEYGLKETALKLLSDNGAVAGVNADFFGMTGSYSASFGPFIEDGELVSVGTDKNLATNEFAAYFMDDDGNSFIDYLKFTADFKNETGAKLELASINKITQMVYPIYFSAAAASDTADLDDRFSGLVKLEVVNNRITYISQPGETVNCPSTDSGYLVIVKDAYADYATENFKVGDIVQTEMNSSIDLDSIKTAIGGGGRILVDGNAVSDGTIITGRQPRTALGISEDGNTIILLVVDGRGTSIGATQSEMVELMKEYGAYNAMHLDGGGSSTMVVETAEEDSLSVKNEPSDGSPRKIMTALGIFNTSTVGELNEVKLKASSDRAITGEGVSLNVIGFDKYYNKLDVSADQITYNTVGGNAYVDNGVLYATEPGMVTVTATYGGYTGVDTVVFANVSTLTPSTSIVSLSPGQSVSFTCTAKDSDGFTQTVSNGINYTLTNNSIGTINGNTFTAVNNGSGYIECEKNGVKCYIAVTVGGTLKTVESFEGSPSVSFSSYPSTITGSASYTSTASDGSKALQLKYNFDSSDSTQAAYADFSSPITFNGAPDKITISAKGNGTDQWLRGKITDNSGRAYTIDFTKTLNWSGWQDISAAIPTEVSYPIKLETIYVAALSNTDTNEQSVAVDNIRAVVADTDISTPSNTAFTDSQNVDINNKVAGSYYITLAGTVNYAGDNKSSQYDSARAAVSEELSVNSDLIVYAGGSDISTDSSDSVIKYSDTYNFYNYGYADLSIVELTAKNGGLRSTQASQWQKFSKDIADAGNDNVIFIMDCTPSNFSDTLETQLMRSALNTIKNSGKHVYVISASGYSAWNSVKDGIRYINLPGLWYSNGSINSNFSTLTVKVDGNGMYYDINTIF